EASRHGAGGAFHLETGKRVDRLSVELQPEVASSMGFDDEAGLLAIDGLMRSVFEGARVVDAVVRSPLARVRSGAGPSAAIQIEGPAGVLEALAAAGDGQGASARVRARGDRGAVEP